MTELAYLEIHVVHLPLSFITKLYPAYLNLITVQPNLFCL